MSDIEKQRKHPPINLTIKPGHVSFRLCCTNSAAAGVIGHSGAVVRRLQTETSARIHVADAVSATARERVIHVIASSTVDSRLLLGGDTVDVSAAQAALVRVFERILEVNPPPSAKVEGGVAVAKCFILVEEGLVGAVFGEGGWRINNITRDTGASIQVFHTALPPCADPSDKLVKISGGSLAVKKALVLVSQYLQQKASEVGRSNGVSSPRVSHRSMISKSNDVKNNGAVNGVVSRKVIFRLLCPCHAASAVIGWRGRKIKDLEDETGASILFSAPEAGCYERTITISAIEIMESRYSAAQNAVLRVFNESTSSDEERAVTARLLLGPNQGAGLNVEGPSNLSAIRVSTGAELQILDASSEERIIQIDGEYSSVLVALFQVTWRLREIIFDGMGPKGIAPLLPHELLNRHRYVQETATLTEEMNNCRVTGEVNGSLSCHFPPSQFSNGHCLPTSKPPQNLTTANGDFKGGSGNKSAVVMNTKVEISIREDIFASLFGDDGSKLARLRLISCANVEVHDPGCGSDGKVIISGTPDQTLAAQSLLQAFIIAAQ